LFLTLFLLIAFALGIFVERQGWLPGGSGQEPPEARQAFRPFWETWRLVHDRYVDRERINDQRMTHGAILGMLATLGDHGHTTYLTKDEVQRLQENLKGELEGIGASITIRKQRPTIVYTLPNSPARAAGLKAGDVIAQVDGEGVQGMPLDQIVRRVRGPAGSEVHLKVLRGDPGTLVDLAIKRAKVDVPDVAWHMLPGVPIAQVAIRNFGQRTDEQMRAALDQARGQGAKGIILDVRGNPGGLKEQAVKVTSEFLQPGEIVFIQKDAEGHEQPVKAENGGSAADLPMCVLIEEGTASSSEILAGAFQDYQRAKLIGTKTFGTGTVLGEFSLSDGSAVLLAISQWLTPKGRQIWHKGIPPDIEVPLPEDRSIVIPESGEKLSSKELQKSGDTQLLKALEVLKKELR
jgi:carboxyl-terminal processing protease